MFALQVFVAHISKSRFTNTTKAIKLLVLRAVDSKIMDVSAQGKSSSHDVDTVLSEPEYKPASEATASNVDGMTEGLMSLLSPIVQEMDLRVLAVRTSQKELSKEMERLIAGGTIALSYSVH